MRKVKIEIEVDFGDYNDSDWIAEDWFSNQVNIFRMNTGTPEYDQSVREWDYVFENHSDLKEIKELRNFFTNNDIKPEDSLMTIGDFKDRFCVGKEPE